MAQNPGDFVESDDFGIKEFVTDDLYDSVGGTISTTESVEVTMTLTIPSTWLSYNLRAKATFRCIGSPASITTITHQLKKTNTGGVSGGVNATVHGTASPDNHENVAMGGKWTGETATGIITVVLTMIASANSGSVSWDDVFMELWAFRVS